MKKPPEVVAGLGNPGARHEYDRHNAGFWFADALAARLGASFSLSKPALGDAASPPGSPRLIKPDIFMNNSGRAVASCISYYKISPDAVLVAHDEADLSPGAVKLKFGGGAAGHNGIADINRALQNKPFWRLRIGVGRPPVRVGEAAPDIAGYVLSRPSAADRVLIGEAIERVLSAWDDIAAGDWEKAMLILHTSPDQGEANDNAQDSQCSPGSAVASGGVKS